MKPKPKKPLVRSVSVKELIWTEYERFIEDVSQASADAGQPIGQWQDLIGEIIYDLTVRARG